MDQVYACKEWIAKYEYSKKKENNPKWEKYLNLVMQELDVPNGFC